MNGYMFRYLLSRKKGKHSGI